MNSTDKEKRAILASTGRGVMEKYKVDKRGGCVAVSRGDVEKSSNGLHNDMPEVLAYWHGVRTENDDGEVAWDVPKIYLNKADELCELLNSLTADRDMWRAVAEKLSEELAHNRICVDALESYKDCEEHTKFFISCNKCWLDHFKSLVQEGE